MAADTEKHLLAYPWPGNVRELRNAIEWSVFMHDDVELKPRHLPEGLVEPATLPSAELPLTLPSDTFPLDAHIHQVIADALQKHDGNKKKTAEYLQISRRSLYTYLEHIAAIDNSRNFNK